MDILQLINKHKIIAIARKVDSAKILDLCKALYEGGIRILEITFDQKSPTCNADTFNAISTAVKGYGDKMVIGAGTVMNLVQADFAERAGAKFILSPVVDKDVIEFTVRKGLVSVPGALTPTEIAKAYEYGASIVKLFPAGDLGVSYIKSILAPLSHIPVMAVGGINDKNLKEFLSSGITSVGIGSNIVKNSYIESGEFEKLTELAKMYTSQV